MCIRDSSGRNRIVRRMFEHLGYKVTKLDRVYFAGLTKQRLKRGEWRDVYKRQVPTIAAFHPVRDCSVIGIGTHAVAEYPVCGAALSPGR